MLCSTLQTIRVMKSVDTWKAALQEATYQYNLFQYQTSGFSPHLLHYGYEPAGPGLLHPKGVQAKPPINTPQDKIKFTKHKQEFREFLCDEKSTNDPKENREVLFAEDSESPS